MIAVDWAKKKTDKETRVMIQRAQYARILMMIGYAVMLLSLILFIVLPLLGTSVRYITNVTDPDKILPFQTHYLYDKNRSPYFELTFVGQTLTAIISAASYSGVDNLFGLLVFHLCGQMENLKEKLINIRTIGTFHDGLAFVVKDHIRLIKLIKIVSQYKESYTLLKEYYKYVYSNYIYLKALQLYIIFLS